VGSFVGVGMVVSALQKAARVRSDPGLDEFTTAMQVRVIGLAMCMCVCVYVCM
jgi:hypothetical protein